MPTTTTYTQTWYTMQELADYSGYKLHQIKNILDEECQYEYISPDSRWPQKTADQFKLYFQGLTEEDLDILVARDKARYAVTAREELEKTAKDIVGRKWNKVPSAALDQLAELHFVQGFLACYDYFNPSV